MMRLFRFIFFKEKDNFILFSSLCLCRESFAFPFSRNISRIQLSLIRQKQMFERVFCMCVRVSGIMHR